MSKQYISVRYQPKAGWYSVDISHNQHSGGYCRVFRWLGDVVAFIRNETGTEYAAIYTHEFAKHGDWSNQ